jgi:DNA-binding CsgD family transcriptional regulator
MKKNPPKLSKYKWEWQGFLLTYNKFLIEGLNRELSSSKYRLIGWDSEVNKLKEIAQEFPLDFVLISYPEQQRTIVEIQQFISGEILLFDSARGCLLEISDRESLVQQLDQVRKMRLLGSRPLRIRGDELYCELAKKTVFSEKERQILHYLSYGYTYEQISEVSHLTVSTIRSYIYDLRNKLNAHDKAHLVGIAFRSGLVY